MQDQGKMKTNKEVIDSLQEYYLNQDPKTVARALANMMIDIHRIVNINILTFHEKSILISRMHSNEAQLLKFIKEGPSEKFKLHNIENEG